MQEFAAEVGPEFMHEIKTGVSKQIKSYSVENGRESLPLSGNIEVS